MIKLNSYFFEVSDHKFKPKEIGNERRGFDGTRHSNYIDEYMQIELTITNLTSERHSQLLYLVSLNRENDTAKEHLIFNNFLDDEYLSGEDIAVDIPFNSYDFNRLEGEKERYEWTLTLEEV